MIGRRIHPGVYLQWVSPYRVRVVQRETKKVESFVTIDAPHLALSCRGLTRYYGSQVVVDRLDLEIPVGSVVGLMGRNGAGKSTAIRMMLGLLAPTRGTSRILGCDSSALTPDVRERIGHLSETHPVYDWMTVAEHGAFNAHGHPRWQQHLFDEAIDHFDLAPTQKMQRISRGQRAGACLAALLATDPELLVLDDPALGLDPLARQDLVEALLVLARRKGRTILLSSHYVADVERLADRIAVMDHGVLRVHCSALRFHQALHRVVLTFAGTPPEKLPVTGLLVMRKSAHELDITVIDESFNPDELAHRCGADSARVIQQTFEENFLSYISQRRERPGLLSRAAGAA